MILVVLMQILRKRVKFKNEVMWKLPSVFLRGLTAGDCTSSVFKTTNGLWQLVSNCLRMKCLLNCGSVMTALLDERFPELKYEFWHFSYTQLQLQLVALDTELQLELVTGTMLQGWIKLQKKFILPMYMWQFRHIVLDS